MRAALFSDWSTGVMARPFSHRVTRLRNRSATLALVTELSALAECTTTFTPAASERGTANNRNRARAATNGFVIFIVVSSEAELRADEDHVGAAIENASGQRGLHL